MENKNSCFSIYIKKAKERKCHSPMNKRNSPLKTEDTIEHEMIVFDECDFEIF